MTGGSTAPMSSLGRLRVSDESASWAESRGGGNAGTLIASSAETDSIRS